MPQHISSFSIEICILLHICILVVSSTFSFSNFDGSKHIPPRQRFCSIFGGVPFFRGLGMIQQLTYDGIWVMMGLAGLSHHNHELNVQQKRDDRKSLASVYIWVHCLSIDFFVMIPQSKVLGAARPWECVDDFAELATTVQLSYGWRSRVNLYFGITFFRCTLAEPKMIPHTQTGNLTFSLPSFS